MNPEIFELDISRVEITFSQKSRGLIAIGEHIRGGDRKAIAHFRRMIFGSRCEHTLFPFVRACDYALTGDREHVETLSSNIKPVVEDILKAWEVEY